jgi:hypothetical protein
MSGCALALLILGGVFVLGGLVAIFFVWQFATSPDGRKVVSAVTNGAALVQESQRAPGTKELRAIGCVRAMVFDPTQVQEIASTFVDAGAEPSGDRLQVVCSANNAAVPPTCDRVAATYVAAVGQATGPFVAVVTASGDAQKGCIRRYMADGRPKTN